MPRTKRLLMLAAVSAVALISAGCSGGGAERAQAGGEARERSYRAGATAEADGNEREAAVERLGVRDAVGQMFVVGMSGTEPDYYIEKMVRERNIGGVLLFGYNMQSAAQTRALTDSLQELSMATEPAVPMIFAVDHEGGLVQSAPWVEPEPAAAEVGAAGDPDAAQEQARRIGEQLLEGGVNADFSPVVDTGSGAAITTRSFGDDPALVSEMGAASVRGFEEAGIASSAKHFPNHGPATEDSHVGRPVVDHDLATVESYDLPPFRAAVEAGVPMVMVGHLVYGALDAEAPASLSPEAYRLLREDLGFEGVAVTDDLAMEGATRGGTTAEAAVAAVEAGADLLVLSSAPQEQADAYDAVVSAVRSGRVPREQVDESVGRIRAMKERYGMSGE